METPLDTAYVGGNVRRLRDEYKLNLTDLSERLDPLGVHLGKNALSKLESGGRKISVEELVALALALDVTPNRLLLGEAADHQKLCIADVPDVTRALAWRWAAGEEPLLYSAGVFDSEEAERTDYAEAWKEIQDFQRRNRLHNSPTNTPGGLIRQVERTHAHVIEGLLDGFMELESQGLKVQDITELMENRLMIQFASGKKSIAELYGDSDDER